MADSIENFFYQFALLCTWCVVIIIGVVGICRYIYIVYSILLEKYKRNINYTHNENKAEKSRQEKIIETEQEVPVKEEQADKKKNKEPKQCNIDSTLYDKSFFACMNNSKTELSRPYYPFGLKATNDKIRKRLDQEELCRSAEQELYFYNLQLQRERIKRNIH